MNRNNGKINSIKYVFKRLIRLTPPIVFPILLVFLMPLYPNGGPVYNSSTGSLRETCAKNWWRSLLFINNWMEANETVRNSLICPGGCHVFQMQCLPHLWFVSSYLQLTLISMVVLITTYKRPKLLNAIVIVMVITGIVFPMYMTYNRGLSAKSPIMDRPLLE